MLLLLKEATILADAPWKVASKSAFRFDRASEHRRWTFRFRGTSKAVGRCSIASASAFTHSVALFLNSRLSSACMATTVIEDVRILRRLCSLFTSSEGER